MANFNTDSGQGPSAINRASAIDGTFHQLLNEDGRLCLVYRGARLDFNCICGMKFNSSKTLKDHLKRCGKAGNLTEINSYRCVKCLSDAFDSVTRISRHFTACDGSRAAVVDTGSQPTSSAFVCRYCTRSFGTVTGRGLHEARAHVTLLDANAPKGKVRQWTSAEQDLLLEAEATILLDNDGSEPANLGEKLMKYIKDRLPTFCRTTNAIMQRRKWSGTQYRSDVAQRMDLIATRRRARSTSLGVANNDEGNQADTNQEVADEQGAMDPSSLSASTEGTRCDCKSELSGAINGHLESLAVIGVKEYLRGILHDLEYYSTANPSKILLREGTTSSASPTNSHPVKSSQGGNDTRKAQCAKVREILEKQGHKRCLQYLRNPTNAGKCSLETVHLFKEMFEDSSARDDIDSFELRPTNGDSHIIHKRITEDEVRSQLKNIPRSTAPGPDGIRIADLMLLHPSDLACLFNIFLFHGNVPSALKVNRTTMIPKSATPGIGDWRPITVASCIDRLFAKVLEARLSYCLKLDPSQRGFMRNLDGCGENIGAYSGALRYARTKGQPLAIVSVDLAKAFDSVQHSTIRRALTRLGVDAVSIELLMSLCHGHKTQIQYDGGVEEVQLLKGVRQGWPLSPVLFLSVVDELLSDLNPADGFCIENEAKERHYMTGLAFADDVILYSSSDDGIHKQLQRAVNWCTARGMRINPKKSSVLYLRRPPKQKRVVLSSLEISIEGVQIPCVTDTFERVLGVHIHHTGRVDHKTDSFSKDLELVCNSKLRPSQKVSMIKNCLVPMIKYRLVYGLANLGACRQLDRAVRMAVKKVLHLPNSISNNAIHLPKVNGGLGIPCFYSCIPLEQAKLTARMMRSNNAITQILAHTRPLNLVASRHNVDTSNLNDIDKKLDNLKLKMTCRKLAQHSQTCHGNGWSLFKNAPQAFLEDPRKCNWSDRDMIEALKLRSNVSMTRELAARATARGQSIDVRCRGCHETVESQAHIISHCASTQQDRVARHDSVCTYLTRRLDSSKSLPNSPITEVHREYRVTMNTGDDGEIQSRTVQRPDIAIFTPQRIVLVEVSVVYEHEDRGSDSLRRIRSEKFNKYKTLCKVLAGRFGRRCELRTVIVGCRGGWLTSNNKVFKNLGLKLSPLDREACVQRAVRGSIICYRRFFNRVKEPLIRHLRQERCSN